MLQIIAAILPVFLLIFLGVWLRARGFPGDGFWGPAERLTYFVLFPVLIVTTLAKADLAGLSVLPMAAGIVTTLVTMTVLLVALRHYLGVDGPGFTSLVQGAIRMNTYICLAIAAALWGHAGVSVAAIVVAVMVPTVNVLSVTVLARFGTQGQPSPGRVLKQLVTNPLIVAAVGGVLLNVSGLRLPPVIGPMLEILGRAALPLGLLAVGAALDFRAARANARLIAQNTLTKLALTPAIAAVILWAFGVEGLTASVALLFLASPTATSSYILARQLGGDAVLMAGILTAQTGAAMITLPVVLTLAG
ncbi:AEC family transporter [Ferruginivarius sediminum]|uniref:AEC family transporter n=1 Tax=Ferruginivarius sediminum TaxID=2661937 RepID=A0A369TEF8_9PROT|nr:AEC family transporter [Ferruginivarius sediminum]RDD62755.1 AEC family transporter [Ferruginivarius sediminum]